MSCRSSSDAADAALAGASAAGGVNCRCGRLGRAQQRLRPWSGRAVMEARLWLVAGLGTRSWGAKK